MLLDCVRIPRAEVPETDDARRTEWLDDQWLLIDQRVDALLAERDAALAAAEAAGEEP